MIRRPPRSTLFHYTTLFRSDDYRRAVQSANTVRPRRPLSLYFHIPFCDTVCYYCACNKIVTRNRKRGSEYLKYLHREIAMQGALFGDRRPVNQLHWGGGTPTFISHGEMRELMRVTGEHFRLRHKDEGEYSIEVDPREATRETIALLREIGFNRLSMGVQDLDPKVQAAVNRIQPEQQTRKILEAARETGFRSVAMDLIYGLPFQSEKSFDRTLDRIIAMDPDRIALFNYAHLPKLFKTQRQIDSADLPSADIKLAILKQSIERLTGAGYRFIGMDHFAKEGDDLTRALDAGRLHRNFQGYSTHADCDLVAMGVTGIGRIDDTYSQNSHILEDYYNNLDAGELPIRKGTYLHFDDRLRATVIQDLMCRSGVDFARIYKHYGIEFTPYFRWELQHLSDMEADGLLRISPSDITITPRGRLLVRNACMIFDRYLTQDSTKAYSRTL